MLLDVSLIWIAACILSSVTHWLLRDQALLSDECLLDPIRRWRHVCVILFVLLVVCSRRLLCRRFSPGRHHCVQAESAERKQLHASRKEPRLLGYKWFLVVFCVSLAFVWLANFYILTNHLGLGQGFLGGWSDTAVDQQVGVTVTLYGKCTCIAKMLWLST